MPPLELTHEQYARWVNFLKHESGNTLPVETQRKIWEFTRKRIPRHEVAKMLKVSPYTVFRYQWTPYNDEFVFETANRER